MPFALATEIGSILDCADHSYSVCFLQRSTISVPVMAAGVTVVVIYPWLLVSEDLALESLSLDLNCPQRRLGFDDRMIPSRFPTPPTGPISLLNNFQQINLKFPAVFFCPTFNHDFLIRVEFDPIAALAMEIAEKTVLPSTEREICHWRRHADIDSNVSSRHLVAEATRGRSARSKQRGLITVGAAF